MPRKSAPGPAATPSLQDLRTNLRAAREAQGLSQGALAAACGVSVQTVYRWESGDREPSATALGALARALGVSADVLLGIATTAAPMPRAPR